MSKNESNKKKQQDSKFVNITKEENLYCIINNEDLQQIIVNALMEYEKLKIEKGSTPRFFKQFIIVILSGLACALIGTGGMLIYQSVEIIIKDQVFMTIFFAFLLFFSGLIYIFFGVSLFNDIKFIREEKDKHYILAFSSMLIALIALLITLIKEYL